MRKLIVAALALLIVAIGAVAYASIPGPDGVIHGCRKNSDGSLRAIDSAATCPSGWTALNWSQTGPQGPAGPAGPQGPAGVSGYQVVTAVQDWPGGSGSFSGTLEAQCPGGKKVLGGGWRSQQLDVPNLRVHWSYPDDASNWWSVRYTVVDATAAFTMTVYATCAVAS
jgi:hypothetical protein